MRTSFALELIDVRIPENSLSVGSVMSSSVDVSPNLWSEYPKHITIMIDGSR